ncbi:MAG: cytochrome c maturation protein CcmE [Chitinophagales bacterium]|jgi:cytochrome c-type biogenesis protein CcmE|nr:cytochrome c maturation protein CcmE [Chitinophagales bacterium]
MKKIHIIGLVMIAVAIGFIITLASDYSQYETFSSAQGETKKDFHIVGTLVKQKDQYYEPTKDPNYFTFYLQDKNGEERKVVFNGTKPQDFDRSEQIVLTGKMSGSDFHATHILMKCPSKYKIDELEVTEYKANS